MATKQSTPKASPAAAPRPDPQGWPEEPRDFLAGLDAVLLVAVPLLTLLLASFAARNSDFWIHAAIGRLLAAGQYTFGADPLSFTTENVYWVNHAWLYDLVLYLLYENLGGPAVVLIKALMLVGLSLVLLTIRRPGQSYWLPAAVTLLAVLAMSPRFLLLPAAVSYLFLGLTFWLLSRPVPAAAKTDLFAPRHLWLLPPLFALWVNLDAWFFLGPLCVGLFLLGEVLQDTLGPPLPAGEQTAPNRRVLGAVLVVGVAACLINPFHIWAFSTLPMELSSASGVEAALQDDRLSGFFLSPFSARFFGASVGASIAGLAFFPLVLAGAVSFALNWTQPRWGRTLIWIVFFLPAALRWQLVPFFAVVAAPITVLNFQDFVARRARAAAGVEGSPLDRLAWDQLAAFFTFRWWPSLNGSGKAAVVLAAAVLVGGVAWLAARSENAAYTLTLLSIPTVSVVALAYLALLVVLGLTWLTLFVRYRYEVLGLWGLAGRFLTLLAVLVLLVAVWPGWLQLNARALRNPQQSAADAWRAADAYRVNWDVTPEPSLVRAARQMQDWRKQGLLPENARGLNLSHQVAGYWAYFGGEKSFYDLRLTLFGGDTIDGVHEVYDALVKDLGRKEDEPQAVAEERYVKRMARLRDILREHGITHVIAFGTEGPGAVAMRHLLTDPAQWQPLYLDGRTGVFAWKDPQSAQGEGPLAALHYGAAARAFGDVPEAERVPEPKLQILNSPWGLGHYLVPPTTRPIESDESDLHRIAFLSASQNYALRQTKLWHDTYPARLPGYAAIGVATDGGVGSALAALSQTALRVRIAEPIIFPEQFRTPPKQRSPQDLNFLRYSEISSVDYFRAHFDAGPPEHILLAVRAARRATAQAPQDASSWQRLADAYETMASGTRERVWSAQFPKLALVRRAQLIASLKATAALKENAAEVHHHLATMFRSMNFLDLYRDHFREGARLFKERGPEADVLPERFDATVEEMAAAVEKIEKGIKEQLDLYLTASQGKRPLEQAQMALDRGLALEALQVLQRASQIDLGVAGYQMQVQLLLDTGRLEELRGLNWDEVKGGLGYLQTDPLSPQVPAAAWFRLLLAASSGEYVVARQQLDALIEYEPPQIREMLVSRQPGPSLASVILDGGQVFPTGKPPGVYAAAVLQRAMFTIPFEDLCARHMLQRADLLALRGILALEAGDTKSAEGDFRASLAMAPEFGGKPAALGYLELIEAARKK